MRHKGSVTHLKPTFVWTLNWLVEGRGANILKQAKLDLFSKHAGKSVSTEEKVNFVQ